MKMVRRASRLSQLFVSQLFVSQPAFSRSLSLSLSLKLVLSSSPGEVPFGRHDDLLLEGFRVLQRQQEGWMWPDLNISSAAKEAAGERAVSHVVREILYSLFFVPSVIRSSFFYGVFLLLW